MSGNRNVGMKKEFVNVYPGPPKSAFMLQDEELTDEENEDAPSAKSILARTKRRSISRSGGEEEEDSQSRHERVRADALQLLQMANDKSGTLSPQGWSQNHNQNHNQKQKRGSDRKTSRKNIMDMDMDDASYDEEDIVNVVSMGSRMGRAPLVDLDEIIIQEEEEVSPKRGGRWSNRYSVSSTLQRMQGPLASLDRDQDQENRPKSANNMFRSRAPPPVHTNTEPNNTNSDTGKSKMGSMLRDFIERFENEDEELANKTSPSTKVSLLKSMWTNVKSSSPLSSSTSPKSPTIWSNVNLADRSAQLPESPFDARSEELVLAERRRRRDKRIVFAVFVTALVAIVIGTVILTSQSPSNAASTDIAALSPNPATSLTFVITADTFRPADQKYLNTQLYDLPRDASFLVHLGDLSQSKTSLCARSVYTDAKDLLKASSLVTFVLPGQEDWNNCPKPDTALTYWRENLSSFEQNFQLTNMPPIEHAFNRIENFAFFWDGILLIGLNLVGGTVHSEEEWSERHTENVRFTEQKLHHYRHEVKAVVLFGHAEPTSKVGDYFWPVCQQIKSLDIPMLYLHASSEDQDILLTYQPFTHTPNLYAAPTRHKNPDVGSPFLKVTIDLSKQQQQMFQFAQL